MAQSNGGAQSKMMSELSIAPPNPTTRYTDIWVQEVVESHGGGGKNLLNLSAVVFSDGDRYPNTATVILRLLFPQLVKKSLYRNFFR